MAEFAIIKTGNKQYKVKAGDTLNVEKLNDSNKKIEFKDLLFQKTVSAEIIAQQKGDKIRILKQQPKKRHLRINGHRQKYSLIKIEKIS